MAGGLERRPLCPPVVDAGRGRAGVALAPASCEHATRMGSSGGTRTKATSGRMGGRGDAVRFYDPVIEASEHPIIAYHIPKYAVPVPADLVEALPFWGVKDSGGEPDYAEAVLKADKGVLVGTEDDVRGRVVAGAQGAISALANFVPEEVVALYESACSGERRWLGCSRRPGSGRKSTLPPPS